jgi:hypothetical protein
MKLLQDNRPTAAAEDPDARLQRTLTALRHNEPWPDDAGPSLDIAPFAMNPGENISFNGIIAAFKRRSVDGTFIFVPDSGAAEFTRSGARLQAEFMAGLIDRIDRRGRTSPDAFRQYLADVDARYLEENTTSHFLATAKRNKAYTEAYFAACNTYGRLPRSGPSIKGGLAEARDPPRDLAEVIANEAVKMNDPTPPSWKTILPYLNKATPDGFLRLIDAGDGRALREQPDRLPQSVENIIGRIFRERLLQPDGDTIRSVTKLVRNACNRANETRAPEERLHAPCLRTIQRRVSRIPGIELVRCQRENKKDRHAYRITGKIERPSAPFLEGEFDWKLVRVWVYSQAIFDEYGEVFIYRPWKGMIVDRFNSAIVGHFLTMVSPSRQEFFAFLRDLVKPLPAATRQELGCFLIPPHRGLFRAIITDKASELIKDSSVASLHDLGVSIRPTGPASPWQKPFVESRHAGEDEELLSKLPGYDPKEIKDAKAPESMDALLSDVELAHKLDDYYYKYCWMKQFDELPRSPMRMMEDFIRANPGWAPPMPSSIEALDRCLTIRKEVTATVTGVRYMNLEYNSHWVRDIRSDCQAHRNGNPKVKILIRPHDLSAIYVEHPSGQLELVPSLMPRYTKGLDLFRHKRVVQARNIVKQRDREEDEDYLLRILAALVDVAKRPFKKRRSSSRDAGAFLLANARGNEGCPLDAEVLEIEASEIPATPELGFAAKPVSDDSDESADLMKQLADQKAKAHAAALVLSTSSFANDDVAPQWRRTRGQR